jgi:hypothetical protein
VRILPKTWVLGAVALLLLFVALLDHGSRSGIDDGLPRLPALDRETATRIEITSVTEKIVVEKTGPDTWKMTAPISYDADGALVSDVLTAFRKEIAMDVRVDSGNDETYGLDANDGLVVEIWAGGDEPAISLIVGFDAVGGSSFVRLSGDPGIYRARVGGRARYAVPSAGWRNRTLLRVDPAKVVAIDVLRPGEVHLVRGPADTTGTPGEWQLDPDPGWPVDQGAVRGLVQALGILRAEEILDPSFDGGFNPAIAAVSVTLEDGTEEKFVVGSHVDRTAAFLRVEGRAEVFRVAVETVRALVRPLDDYRDKTLLAFSPNDLETMSLREGRNQVVLRQDLATRLWQVVEPRNVDMDPKLVMFALRTLSSLRALDVVDIDPAAAGLDRPKSRIEVTFFDGTAAAVEVGNDVPNAELVYVRKAGGGPVMVLGKKTFEGLRRAFGRS